VLLSQDTESITMAEPITGPTPKQLAHRWKPGTSGNPGGRPRSLEKRVRELVDFDAITRGLADIALGKLPEGLSEGSTVKIRDRIEAAKLLYDRGFGKAKITVDLAADIATNGLAGMNVRGMDSAALDILHDTIIDAIAKPKNANPVPAPRETPTLIGNLVALAEVRELVREPDTLSTKESEAPAPAPAALPEAPEPAPAPAEVIPARLLRHTFKGSHNVAQAVLNLDTQEVDVVFTSGARYRFADFTEEKFAAWKLAVSAGKFFNSEIKSRPDLHPPVGARMS
jgi:hypothetical protein